MVGRPCNNQTFVLTDTADKISAKPFGYRFAKNKRATKPAHKPTQFAAHLFLPNRTKTLPVLTIFAIK